MPARKEMEIVAARITALATFAEARPAAVCGMVRALERGVALDQDANETLH